MAAHRSQPVNMNAAADWSSSAKARTMPNKAHTPDQNRPVWSRPGTAPRDTSRSERENDGNDRADERRPGAGATFRIRQDQAELRVHGPEQRRDDHAAAGANPKPSLLPLRHSRGTQ